MVQKVNAAGRRAKVLYIVGPTAVGKSKVAILVAERIGGEIVSADSRQIFAGIEIGSGALTTSEQRGIAHHLLASEPPGRKMTAAEFAKRAQQIVKEIVSRGHLPMVVGGSGLYIKALLDGLTLAPPASKEIRYALSTEIESKGMPAMREELQSVDPDYARYVGPNDHRRLIRALEVYRTTGKPLSSFHTGRGGSDGKAMVFGLNRPRGELIERIKLRIRQMLDSGWIEEVNRLFGSVSLDAPVWETVGCKQLASALRGEITVEKAIELTEIATRQFAKRQMTWFRADERIIWLEGSGEGVEEQWAEEIVRQWSAQPGQMTQ